MDHTQNFLATEKPGKLMRKYAIPCITSRRLRRLEQEKTEAQPAQEE